MREPSHHLRFAILDTLTDSVPVKGVNISFYNQVPSDAVYPYGIITTASNTDDSTKDFFISDIIIRIEVATRYSEGSGGEFDCNSAIDKILTLLVRNNFDLADAGFSVVTAKKESVSYVKDITNKFNYYRGIIEMAYKVEQKDTAAGLQNQLQKEL